MLYAFQDNFLTQFKQHIIKLCFFWMNGRIIMIILIEIYWSIYFSAGSQDQSPRLSERFSGDFDSESIMNRLRHDIEDAMNDSSHPIDNSDTGELFPFEFLFVHHASKRKLELNFTFSWRPNLD